MKASDECRISAQYLKNYTNYVKKITVIWGVNTTVALFSHAQEKYYFPNNGLLNTAVKMVP